MGYGVELKCRECDYSEDFFLGVGMMYFPLRNAVNEENLKYKKLRRELMDIIDNHSVKESNYGHELYRCEQCNKLYRRFYVELNYDEDRTYRTEYNCTKCRKPLTRLDEFKIEEIPCPKCGREGLYQDMVMLWD
jgi:DNA-directed RNA polymerase subunit RPC12/RpoP